MANKSEILICACDKCGKLYDLEHGVIIRTKYPSWSASEDQVECYCAKCAKELGYMKEEE